MLSIIVAMDKNRVIGINGDMPWSRDLPTDLRHFKDITEGHTLIMGRKTFESLGRPLLNRKHVVLTYQGVEIEHPDVVACNDIGFVIENAVKTKEEIFVIGGAEIYKQLMPYADRLYITEVQHTFTGDTFFPDIDKEQWRLQSIAYPVKSDRDQYEIQFMEYVRK